MSRGKDQLWGSMSDRELTNVADSIARHAVERPWAVAILDSTAAMHYRTLDALVWAAASHMHRSGIRSGDVVGLALPHSALYLVAVYALARMGACSVALPLSDPAPLREALAQRFSVRWVLALAQNAGPPGVPTVVVTFELLNHAPATPQFELRSPGSDANWNIRRTSGTTGEPKGIARTHRKALAILNAHAANYPGPNHRILGLLELSTSFGLTVAERAFYCGCTFFICPTNLDISDFMNDIDRYGITHVYLTPNNLSALLPLLPTDSCRFPGLLEVLVAGMAMPEALRAAIRRRFTPNLTVQYGANEIGAMTIADRKMQEEFPETVGQVRPGVDLEIVDELDNPVPRGELGIVRARAPWMAASYLGSVEKTSSNFRKGWLYPGDIGVMSAEGMLFLRGRTDDMMNFDGIKILPVDIEEALLAHPAVVEAAAFPVMSSVHQNLPAAAVILSQPVSAQELLAHCRSRLGVRSPVYISVEQSFPRNPGGKVLRTELAARLEERLSGGAKP
jgi:acyl-CoA synthetase (AMP-forming)/AMP-acid ligase II